MKDGEPTLTERQRFGRARRIGEETIRAELGLRVVMCMGAEHRWQGFYRKYLIMNARPRLVARGLPFWAYWIGALMRNHWDERYDATGKRVA